MKTNLRADRIYRALPRGYRWATSLETEAVVWPQGTLPAVVDWIQVQTGGTDDEPWTDLAVPVGRYEEVEDNYLVCEVCGRNDEQHTEDECFK